ncbi:MAG: hypothetical protein PUP93_30180 [Rhizonema sp. NSF051]|nr:hypothetical protein [Rhizonema sp. NSF051]
MKGWENSRAMPVLEIETNLLPGQLNKFKKLFAAMKLIDGKAYFPQSEMHGVLLTQSRQVAINRITAHLDIIQQYVFNEGDNMYIKHIGIDNLLDKLAEDNPKKKIQYLAVRAYISACLANNPEVFKDAELRIDKIENQVKDVMAYIRKNALKCVLSGKPFTSSGQCHVHHVEGVSERPDLQAVASNLLPVWNEIHTDYHRWANNSQKMVTRATLKEFARIHGYRTDW